jgi:hypothetical protein
MVENSFFRTTLMVLIASCASLSAEAWLRAGENSDQPSPDLPYSDTLETFPKGEDEFALPDETVGAFTADLKARVEKDLKVRLPEDFEFVKHVIELVENDTLPLKLVNRCYLWARKQPIYQFQHFQRAVRKQAREIGVEV